MTYATMDNSGLHVVDPEIAKEISKKEISPSLITGVQGCAARWVGDNFVIPKFMEVDKIPAVRGSAYHWVMEEFFKLPQGERSKVAIKQLIKQCFQHDDYQEFFRNHPEQKKWLVDAVKSYYQMGAQPDKVEIAEFEKNGKTRKGIEIFVKGKLGDSSRKTLGLVDRVRKSKNNPNNVIVEDWKTGANARGEWEQLRQQIIYTMLMEQDGVKVAGASLIYPVAQKVVKVPINDQKLRDKVIKDIEQTDKDLTTMIEENTFEYSPSFLCAWCPLVKICPAASFRKVGKLKEAYEEQPSPEELEKGIELV